MVVVNRTRDLKSPLLPAIVVGNKGFIFNLLLRHIGEMSAKLKPGGTYQSLKTQFRCFHEVYLILGLVLSEQRKRLSSRSANSIHYLSEQTILLFLDQTRTLPSKHERFLCEAVTDPIV